MLSYSLPCSPTEINHLRRDEQFWKWHRFSHDSQSVLIYGMIPRPAVLASIPILQILHKMPSYFLRKDVQILDGNPLDQVAWDYIRHKSSYRRFCQHMSKLFCSRPFEVRLRDSTAGAVRLALSFLRPFFHHVVQEDFDIAISYLRTFALTISQWPSQSWVNDHPEVHQVVESMVLALGEELRDKYRHQQQEEISRLQVIIDGLRSTIRAQGPQTVLDNVEVDSDGDFEIVYEETDEPTLVTTVDAPSVRKRPSLEMSIVVLPRLPISFQTPITPPESPNHSFFIPTVVVPSISNAVTPVSISKFVLRSQDRDKSSSTSPKPSEKSSFSTPVRPSRSPVFSLPSAHHLENSVSSDNDEKQKHAAAQVCTVEQQPANQSSIVELDDQYNEDGNESLPSPSTQHWNPPPPSPTLSSRRSSIASIDTLCESSEFPFKRFSIASYNSEILDPVPALPIEIPSRGASFSDPWSTTASVTIPPPETDASIIPLPPSPSSLTAHSDSSTPPTLLSSPITPRLSLADLPSSSNPESSSVTSEGTKDDRRSTTRVVETASIIVTGFLVGAFFTLFLFSTQRRTLLYLTWPRGHISLVFIYLYLFNSNQRWA